MSRTSMLIVLSTCLIQRVLHYVKITATVVAKADSFSSRPDRALIEEESRYAIYDDRLQ